MPLYARPYFWLLALAVALFTSGCDNDNRDEDAPASPTRGKLLHNPPQRVHTLSATDLAVAAGADIENQEFLRLAGTPKCRVDVHLIEYHTVGGRDEPTTASGALMVPAGVDAECQGDRPVLLYAHGTTTEKAFDMTDVAIPNSDNPEALLIAIAFAARGYIVVAPNYAGYDTSTLSYHPYLNGDQQSKDMIDALTAARSALPTIYAPTTRAGNKLFISGYSQGGYVAMATHRAMQATGTMVTASAPMSGPYAMSAQGDAVFYGNVNLGAPLFSTLVVTSYQRSYGNLYSNPNEIFEARYVNGIETLLPSTLSRSQLFQQGRLPQTALFSPTPPDPAYASITPPTTPAQRAPLFALGFGPDHLVTNAYRLSYLRDAQANPDGAFPTTTNGLPPADPRHPLRRAFKTNDLRTWTPTAPLLMCAGSGDPTVFYLNTQLMQGYWANSTAPITVLDVDSSPANNDPYADYKRAFAALKVATAASAVAQGATDQGARAVLEAYHGQLVSAVCLIAVRNFFDSK